MINLQCCTMIINKCRENKTSNIMIINKDRENETSNEDSITATSRGTSLQYKGKKAPNPSPPKNQKVTHYKKQDDLTWRLVAVTCSAGICISRVGPLLELSPFFSTWDDSNSFHNFINSCMHSPTL